MNTKKEICQQSFGPYEEFCDCKAINNCSRCNKPICFEHSYTSDTDTIICLTCLAAETED